MKEYRIGRFIFIVNKGQGKKGVVWYSLHIGYIKIRP